MYRYIRSSSIRKTRFERELSGELGDFWKRSAEEEIQKFQDDADAGKILLDENGGAYWKSSGNYLPADCVEKLLYTDFEFDPDATASARDEQTSRQLKEYVQNYKGPSAEEIDEMRAAFGTGKTIIDTITGKKIRL